VKHFASPEFWARLEKLPANAQQLARENYELLKSTSRGSTGSGRFASVGRIEHWESMRKAASCGSGSVHTRNTIGWWVERRVRAVA
jgi:hypothetical protein